MTHVPQHFTVWSEIPVRDLDAGIAFYGAVFEAELMRDETGPNPIAFFPVRDMATGIGGHLYKGEPAVNGAGPTVHLEAAAPLDAALDRVRAAGGAVLSDPIPVPDGRFVYCRDPDGNSFSVFVRSETAD